MEHGDPVQITPEAEHWLVGPSTAGAMPLVQGGRPVAVVTEPTEEDRAVVRAGHALAADLGRLSGRAPGLPGKVILVGTLGRSSLFQGLARAGLLDTAALADAWEATLVQVVEEPYPGVTQALCIVGSDRRGAVYGAYALAEQLGVSPWHWWSDSPVAPVTEAWVGPGPFLIPSPRVKYRGIFLNDEYPALTRWVAHRWGEAEPSLDPPRPSGVALYGREFYARVFELLLRLRANTLWPAMWNNAFNEDDPENADLADSFGIVMGTSHQEPMLRAQKEWDRRYQATLGSWDWMRHSGELTEFWRQGIRRNRTFEGLVTIGLRGADDTEMAGATPAERRTMLAQIVDVQRTILAEETGRPAAEVPQVWCLYKEVLDDYRAGLRVPDDVTLLWGEDNWGNLRRLPTADERRRPGGAGIYYHFDYHGGPRSYQWVNTSPLGKVQEQMSLAAEAGADRLWVVNVGHLKGYELPMEFFLRFAWDPGRWGTTATPGFTAAWATREFGPAMGPRAARILDGYTFLNGRKKPELLAPGTYSLVHYRESDRVLGAWEALEAEANAVLDGLPPGFRDSFIQVVQFPVRACALVHRLYRHAGLNQLYGRQGRASANRHAEAVRALFREDLDLMAWYNTTFADGRWNHFMDQTHLGYTSWSDPPQNTLDAIDLAEVCPLPGVEPGLATEGHEASWPLVPGQDLALGFDRYGQQTRWVEVFRRGDQGFPYRITASQDWIRCTASGGQVDDDVRIEVTVDWSRVPGGTHRESLRFDLGGQGVEVPVVVRSQEADPGEGFVESDGLVAIEADHYQSLETSDDGSWERVAPYGRRGAALRTRGPGSVAQGSPMALVEYRFFLFEEAEPHLAFLLGPTLNCYEGRDVAFAWALDGGQFERVVAVPRDYVAQHHNEDWERVVGDQGRTVRRPAGRLDRGWHRLFVGRLEPGLVLEAVVVECVPPGPSALGPPESPRLTSKPL